MVPSSNETKINRERNDKVFKELFRYFQRCRANNELGGGIRIVFVCFY